MAHRNCVIKGIEVQFPFEPYKVQEEYMMKVIECLQKGVHGILESPTGTGKTLCLLCASLAWLENRKALQQATLLQSSALQNNKAGCLNFINDLRGQLEDRAGSWTASLNIRLPKIIYSSRTHSQLSQAIQELKRSSYKHVRSVVLGSREQLCLHPEVSKIQNHSTKVYMCRAKISSRSCPFYLNVEEKIAIEKDYQDNPVTDIEDLVKLGKKHTCCPYYAARTLKSKADIIFTPYNYIIDPKSRKAHGIELQGNVVIFDEAHNIEGACEESMSFQLRSLDLALCINEVSQTMESIKGYDTLGLSVESNTPDFTLTELSILKVMFCELEEQLDKAVAESVTSGSSKPGNFMMDILAKVELTAQKIDVVLDLLDKIILYHSTGVGNPWSSKGAGLQKFSDMLKIMFSRSSLVNRQINLDKEFSQKYRVYLQYETTNKQNAADPWTVSRSTTRKQSWKLNCWCFSPGIGMQDVINQDVYSVILTSGTLSPLLPLMNELGVNFPVQLENPHIVSDKQVFVAVVPQGPDGTPLNSSYQNRSNEKYISSLGRTVVNFCRIVPDGLLVFFPSYSVMKNNIERWEDTGMWQSLSGIKPVFTEPQGKDAFQESIEKFYTRINDPQTKGATLLAVCRGKVSEGLDFADKNARAVIITGLPFPPSMDPQVKLKMSYLNAQEKKGLSGTEWYLLQASRAVNQAIGRVIRHKDDFGAILLCDNRFAEKRNQAQLSRWIRGRVRIFNSFGPALKELSSFFKVLEQTGETRILSSVAMAPNIERGKGSPQVLNRALIEKTGSLSNSFNFNNSETESIFESYFPSLKVKEQGIIWDKPIVVKRKQSIFEALEECTQSVSFIDGANCISSKPTSLCSDILIQSCSNVSSSSVDPKRRKISFKLRDAESVGENDKDIEEKGEKQKGIDKEGENQKGTDREVWKKFLIKIKALLGATEKYGKFCKAVKEYKAQKNTVKFAHEILNIFSGIPNKETYLHLVSVLVSPHERNKFRELCSLEVTSCDAGMSNLEDRGNTSSNSNNSDR